MGKNQWVVPHKGKWAVRAEGAKRVTKIFEIQEAARKQATVIAKNQKSEVFIQNRHGNIRSKDSYGKDPHSIKDTEH